MSASNLTYNPFSLPREPLVLRTSSAGKLAEFQRFGLNIRAEPGEDLEEVEGTPEEVIVYKALAAGSGVLVEDTSLDVEGFDVGVNLRWLLATLKDRLTAAASATPPRATWRVMLAIHQDGVMRVASATVAGHLVAEPRGGGFSFDPHFVPQGHTLTLGEMADLGTKDQCSARKQAAERLLAGEYAQRPVAGIPAWSGTYQQTN